MKSKDICLLALALLAGLVFAAPDSLACRMVDWMDEPGETYYDDGNDCWPPDYSYSGTKNWDLAMGDSFMVWLPGNTQMIFVDHENHSELDTTIDPHSGSENIVLCAIQDSIFFAGGSVYILCMVCREDSIALKSRIYTPFADYHFAALEDSFLYTVGGPGGALTCINVADPESIFIYRTVEGGGSDRGLEVIDGYVYSAWDWLDYNELTGESELSYHVSRADMLNSPTPWVNHYYGPSYSNRSFGASANDGVFVYYVNTEIGSWPDWTIGESDLYVLDTDTSYNFDDKWDGQPAIGIEIVNDHLAAIGFKHGFSILDIDDLSDIHEVAYYMDPDSQFYCTHFAMNEDTVIYAVAHPRDDTCRLYMFHVADSVVSSISDPAPHTPLPKAFEISAWPNPFNSAVTISIDDAGVCDTPLRVEIFDVSGRRVSVIGNYDQPVIARRVQPDEAISYGCEEDCFGQSPRNDNAGEVVWRPDESLPSGVYLVRASAGGRGDLDPDGPSTSSGTVATARIVYLK